VWSPDGKLLVFTGERRDLESDLHYVHLFPEDEQVGRRERSLEQAVAAMEKARRPKGAAQPPEGPAAPDEEDPPTPDFERLWERVHRISLQNTREERLLFAPDGQKLVFSASVDGQAGMYQVDFPDNLKPRLLTATVGSHATWPKAAGKILWLVGGVPTASAGAQNSAYPFSVQITRDRRKHQGRGFDVAWATMRDWFYDGRMNNRDWDAVREKYRDAAARAPDRSTFARVVCLMLGELNGSHLGFSAAPESPGGGRDQWTEWTGDLGLRFDPEHPGPGLRIASVVAEGPCDLSRSRLTAGDVLLRVDGQRVDPGADLTRVLNVSGEQTLLLTVADAAGKEREVPVTPISRGALRELLYRAWLKHCREQVDELSKGTLGYVYVQGMNWSSFDEFEQGLHAAGYGKRGLVIDVRWNGGGFTADHLLTALTQPSHAIAVQRGDGPGYPQDRTVYATWEKPIVVLCNQRSFSNAEIFCHAIRTLRRGRLVGVQTAGGVISTGAGSILDLGTIRIPLRGWFVIDTGEDMEMNGAKPDIEIWPAPEEMANGLDRQLDKAVEVLLEDVQAFEARPKPALRYKSER
jgi:tricorn protease